MVGGSECFRHSLTRTGDGHPPVLLVLPSDNSAGLRLVLDWAGGGSGAGSLIGIGSSPSSI